MVTRWGMSDALGTVQLAPRSNAYLGAAGYAGEKSCSEATARLIDEEVQRIIGECHEQAKNLLMGHRGALDRLAEALLAHETLDEKQILEVTGLPPAPTVEAGHGTTAAQDGRGMAPPPSATSSAQGKR
jgi:cell division protease FtsH